MASPTIFQFPTSMTKPMSSRYNGSLSHLYPFLYCHCIDLPDHNSILLPARDVATTHLAPEQQPVLIARKHEIQFVTSQNLIKH